MLQIPVQGGHRGCELTVKHELGSMKLDRQNNNDHSFYLSASFIDTVHEFLSVSEGWSLMMPFQLNWEKPIDTRIHRLDLPTFATHFKTLRDILSPWNQTNAILGNYDTDLLVIPLKSSYTNTPTEYSSLKSTDRLMVHLLQSLTNVEIRIALVTLYRSGMSNDQQRRHRHREDDGYPESDDEEFPLQDKEEEQGKRFIEQLIEEGCSIGPLMHLNSSAVSPDDPPICWKTDYVHGSIDKIQDIFKNPVSTPLGNEFYNGFNKDEDDLAPDLKQWYYKPVLVVWPKNSIMLKCHSDFTGIVTQLQDDVSNRNWMLPENETLRKTKLAQLNKIIDYCLRAPEEPKTQTGSTICTLLNVCNILKAKEEGIRLYRFCSDYSLKLRYTYLLTEVSTFVNFVGWEDCRSVIIPLKCTYCDEEQEESSGALDFFVQMSESLLDANTPSSNAAAVELFEELCSILFGEFELYRDNNPPIVTYEMMCQVHTSGPFLMENDLRVPFVITMVLEHRQMLSNPHLIAAYIEGAENCDFLFLTENYVFPLFYSLLGDTCFLKITEDCSKLLRILCRRFLTEDLEFEYQDPLKREKLLIWLELFVFMEDENLIQSFAKKMCSVRDAVSYPTVTVLLAEKCLCEQTHFEVARNKLISTWEEVRSGRHDLVTSLKAELEQPQMPEVTEEDRRATLIKKLDRVVTFWIGHSIDERQFPFITDWGSNDEHFQMDFCILLDVCNQLKTKDQILRLFLFHVHRKDVNWLDPHLLLQFVRFVSFVGWDICHHFVNKLISNTSHRRSDLMIQATRAFLYEGGSLCNEAAVKMLTRLSLHLFSGSQTDLHASPDELFSRGLSCIRVAEQSALIEVICLMEHRQLLGNLKVIFALRHYLQTAPFEKLKFVEILSCSALLIKVPFEEMARECRKLFVTLRHRFLNQDFRHISFKVFRCWFKVFIFVSQEDEDQEDLQLLTTNMFFKLSVSIN